MWHVVSLRNTLVRARSICNTACNEQGQKLKCQSNSNSLFVASIDNNVIKRKKNRFLVLLTITKKVGCNSMALHYTEFQNGGSSFNFAYRWLKYLINDNRVVKHKNLPISGHNLCRVIKRWRYFFQFNKYNSKNTI